MSDIRFDFGKNWSRYSSGIDEQTIRAAVYSLSALLGLAGEYRKAAFFDIGCGSGIHAIAAARMGFQKITGIDLDPNSVATTEQNIARFGRPEQFQVFVDDILNSKCSKRFDVVYSWGVLHHTGAMWTAIERASEFVCPGGVFCIAIYKKTKFCGMWRKIKRLYTTGGATLRTTILGLYLMATATRQLAAGRLVRLRRKRGMKRLYDAIDWVGGYPYESASATEVTEFVERLGFICMGRTCDQTMDCWDRDVRNMFSGS